MFLGEKLLQVCAALVTGPLPQKEELFVGVQGWAPLKVRHRIDAMAGGSFSHRQLLSNRLTIDVIDRGGREQSGRPHPKPDEALGKVTISDLPFFDTPRHCCRSAGIWGGLRRARYPRHGAID